MVKLIVTEASGSAKELVLSNERTTIGRHNSNDVCLNDKAVSGNHAVVLCEGKGYLLEDLDSTNGTLVNGRQIAKHHLLAGDTITIGRNTLKFEMSAEAAPVLHADAPATKAQSPLSRELKVTLGKLKVMTGSNAGRELELNKVVTTLGKPGVQVVAFTRKPDGYSVALSSGAADGPKPAVNGVAFGAEPVSLSNGDVVSVIGTEMQFELVTS